MYAIDQRVKGTLQWITVATNLTESQAQEQLEVLESSEVVFFFEFRMYRYA
jgi:hypothetical protein